MTGALFSDLCTGELAQLKDRIHDGIFLSHGCWDDQATEESTWVERGGVL